jgi:hypothetical protein
MSVRNIVILACAIGAVVSYLESRTGSKRRLLVPETSDAPTLEFRCEGKTHCSQMSSCDEAKFYIANCPATQMDGDNDGVPCESQWCGRD